MTHLPEDKRRKVDALRSALASISTSGADLLAANIGSECHLVGDANFGDPSEFVRFLTACSGTIATATAIDPSIAQLLFACARFQGRGLRIPSSRLPRHLLRYTISENLIVDVATLLLGAAARDAYHRGLYPIQLLMEDIRASWRPDLIPATIKVGRGDFVFATFVTPNLPVTAEGIAKSLALPVNLSPLIREVAIFEFEYEVSAVGDVRFPTVADAEDCCLFVPASDVEPRESQPHTWTGWTGGLDGYPSLPEVIHRTTPVRVLTTPPRFMGRAHLGGWIA